MNREEDSSLVIPSNGRSLMRLFIGFVEAWIYDLLHRMRTWETQIADEKAKAQKNGQAVNIPSVDAHEESPLAIVEIDWTESGDEERSSDILRYAAIGLLFDAQERVSHGSQTFDRTARLAWRLADWVISPASHSPLFTPVRNRFDALVERGEEEVNRWVNIGRSEETHSRILAQKVQDDFIDGWIEYLTGNEEIVGLVEMQSASLATEVVEEVRERTVSADTFLEGVARSLLRQMPRAALPEPPPEVRQRAAPLHPKTTRSRKTGAKSR